MDCTELLKRFSNEYLVILIFYVGMDTAEKERGVASGKLETLFLERALQPFSEIEFLE